MSCLFFFFFFFLNRLGSSERDHPLVVYTVIGPKRNKHSLSLNRTSVCDSLREILSLSVDNCSGEVIHGLLRSILPVYGDMFELLSMSDSRPELLSQFSLHHSFEFSGNCFLAVAIRVRSSEPKILRLNPLLSPPLFLLSLSLSVSVFLPLPLSVSLSLSFSVSVSLSLSLSVSVSHTLSQSVFLSLRG